MSVSFLLKKVCEFLFVLSVFNFENGQEAKRSIPDPDSSLWVHDSIALFRKDFSYRHSLSNLAGLAAV